MTLRISWTTDATDDPGAGGFDENGIGAITITTDHVLEFDCVTAEKHEGVSVLTEHAVESGEPITDHKRANPRKLSIEAIVTNTPIGAPPPSGYGAGNVTAQVTSTTIEISGGKSVKANILQFSAEFDRIADCCDTLDRLRLEGTSVTIATRIRTYENMQIVSVSEPRSPEDGDSITFSIECSAVRVASSRTIDAPRPSEPRGAARASGGAQEATDQTREQSRLAAARDDYARRRAAGESRSDAALGAAGSAFGL